MTRGKDNLLRLALKPRPVIPFDEIVRSPDPDAKGLLKEMLDALQDVNSLRDYLYRAAEAIIYYGRDDPAWIETALGDGRDDELLIGEPEMLLESACVRATPRILSRLVKMFPEAAMAKRRWPHELWHKREGDDGSWLHTLAECCREGHADDFEACAKTLLAAGVDPGGKDRAGRSVGDVLVKDGKGECLARWERIAMSGDGKIKKGKGGKKLLGKATV